MSGSAVGALGQPPPARVVVAQARELRAPATVRLVGTVDPVRRSRIGSEIAGIVIDMPVRQGDFVSAGDVLCRLNNDTLTLQLAEATAKFEALRSRHDELLSGTRPEDITRFKALLDETTAEHERWKLEQDRVEALYSGNKSNAKEVYDTRADYLRAERRKVAAQAGYDLAVKGPRKEVIAQAAYDAAAQRAAADRLESDLNKTVVRAPFPGYVVARNVELGEWIPVGGIVVEMVDLSSVLVRVSAPESAMPYLAVGKPAQARVDALKRTFTGTIKHVIRQADPTARTFPVEVEIGNGDGALASGMFARVTLPAGPDKTVLAVPKDAVVERDGIRYVAIVTPSKRGGTVGMLIPVTTGMDIDDWITVRSDAIRVGTTVATRGNERVYPFPSSVIVVDDQGTPVASPESGADGMHKKPGAPEPYNRGVDNRKPDNREGT